MESTGILYEYSDQAPNKISHAMILSQMSVFKMFTMSDRTTLVSNTPSPLDPPILHQGHRRWSSSSSYI